MLVRVVFRLLCPSQSDATQIAMAIQTKLANHPNRKIIGDAAAVREHEGWLVTGNIAFETKVAAEDVRSDVVAKWTSGPLRNLIRTGSTIHLHTCSHANGESPPYPDCRTMVDFQVSRKG